MLSVSKITFADVVVFAVCELTAIPMCHAGWDAVVSGDHTMRGILACVIGLPLGVFGFGFHWWKDKIGDDLRRRVQEQAIRWAPVVILAAFVYVVGPSIYREIVPQTLPPLSQPMPVAPGAPPAEPIAPVRLDIVGNAFHPMTPGSMLAVNFYYANRSLRVPARGGVDGGKLIISPHRLSAEEEKAITLLYFSKDDFPGENIAAEDPPGTSNKFYTVTSDIDEDHLKSMLDGKTFLYVFTYLRYGDPVSGLMTETEWCSWYQGNLVVGNGCLTFTRVFSAAPKRPYLP